MTDAAYGAIVVTMAEREVADLLPIDAPVDVALRTRRAVPFWFHTFALNREHGIYTAGAARDHRYRMPAIPKDMRSARVLDVGTFDGFYAFLAEYRGASRVVAVDNEQYRHWVNTRWGVHLRGGEGFRTVHRLLGSSVDYRVMNAFDLEELDELFDLVLCFGLLHRVEDPIGLLRRLRRRMAAGGAVLIETYGVDRTGDGGATIQVSGPGETYRRDDFVYWGFTHEALIRLAGLAGFSRAVTLAEVRVDSHPRVMLRLSD